MLCVRRVDRTKSDGHGRLTDDTTLAALASLTGVLLGAARAAGGDLVRTSTAVVDSLGIDTGHIPPVL
jgi:hypothetical protein